MTDSVETERTGGIAAERRLQDIRNASHGLSWSQRIVDWQIRTFGRVPNASVAYARMKEEWLELEAEIQGSQDTGKLIKETCDVVICACGFVAALGADLHTEATEKMRVNELEREWVSNGDGTGQHVRR